MWPQLTGQRGMSRRGHRLPLPPLQILERLNKMCGVGEQMRKKQQRLLKNMDAHKVMLDLLQIPYDKVTGWPTRPELCHDPQGQPHQPKPGLSPTSSFESTLVAPNL